MGLCLFCFIFYILCIWFIGGKLDRFAARSVLPTRPPSAARSVRCQTVM